MPVLYCLTTGCPPIYNNFVCYKILESLPNVKYWDVHHLSDIQISKKNVVLTKLQFGQITFSVHNSSGEFSQGPDWSCEGAQEKVRKTNFEILC